MNPLDRIADRLQAYAMFQDRPGAMAELEQLAITLRALARPAATESDCGTCAASARRCVDLVDQGGGRCCGFCTHAAAPKATCGDQIIDAHGVTVVTCELPKGHHWHRDRHQIWLKPEQIPTCAACEAEPDRTEPA